MATIRLNLAELGTPNFYRLQQAMDCSREETLGALMTFLALSEEDGAERGDQEKLSHYCMGKLEVENLIYARYVVFDSGSWVIPRHHGLQARKARRKEISRKAIEAREAKRQAPKKERVRKNRAEKPVPVTRAAWEAYTEGYMQRFQEAPLSNARTRGLVQQFVQRVGADDAPHVLRFYLQHDKKIYIDRMYPLTMAVSDAEALHTQWKRGRMMSGNTADHLSAVETFRREQEDIQAGRL